MRLIDADALKTMLPLTRADVFQNCSNCTLLDDDDVRRLIDKAPTACEWISVKDRLPDDASDVIAYYDCGDNGHVMFVNYYKKCWYDAVFNDLIDDLDQGCITHWMPLPEPPEVRQDDRQR